MFINYSTRERTNDAVEFTRGGWYIKCGYAGFNSSANNRWGYKTKASAEQAVLRYQSK